MTTPEHDQPTASLANARTIVHHQLHRLWSAPERAHAIAPIMLWGPPERANANSLHLARPPTIRGKSRKYR